MLSVFFCASIFFVKSSIGMWQMLDAVIVVSIVLIRLVGWSLVGRCLFAYSRSWQFRYRMPLKLAVWVLIFQQIANPLRKVCMWWEDPAIKWLLIAGIYNMRIIQYSHFPSLLPLFLLLLLPPPPSSAPPPLQHLLAGNEWQEICSIFRFIHKQHTTHQASEWVSERVYVR